MDSLYEIIDSKLLPWAEDTSRRRIVMTGVPMRQSELPEGIRVTRKLPHGPRKTVKGKRNFGDPRSVMTVWPEDNLETGGSAQVMCVLDGYIDFWIEDNVVHCGAGFFLLLPPDARHQGGSIPFYEPDPALPASRQHCDLFWISRHGRILGICTTHRAGIGSEFMTTSGPYAHIINDNANAILDLLIAEAASGNEERESLCRYYLCVLLTLMRRDLKLGAVLLSSRSRLQIERLQTSDDMDQATAYIKNHLDHALTIDTVAESIGMSRSRFTRDFRRRTGKTFSEYVTDCRIEEAKQLLAMSDWSLPWISKSLGLRSISYFSWLFKKQVGMPPHEYRLQRRNDRPAQP